MSGLGSLRHWVCPIAGNECRISPLSHLRLPFLSAEGERALWLHWLPLLIFFTALPPLLLWKKSFMGLSPLSIRASLQFLALTHVARIFSGELPSISLHLMRKRAGPREEVTFPGRCLQVLKKKSAASWDAPIHPGGQTAAERKGCDCPLALYGESVS